MEDTIDFKHPFGARTATAIHRGRIRAWETLTLPAVLLYNHVLGIDKFWDDVARTQRVWFVFDQIRATPKHGTPAKNAKKL